MARDGQGTAGSTSVFEKIEIYAFTYSWIRPTSGDRGQGTVYPILCRTDAPVVMIIEFPLVQSGYIERSLPLRFGQAVVFSVRDCPSSQFEKPSCTRAAEYCDN